ncbi:MAG: hypothetical protein WC905_02605 [Patescibacteria group bacterium]
MQFYTGDWLKDPRLSMCCPSTRGIWIDLLCALHESGRSGIIQGTPEQLSRLCRSTTLEFDQALAELKSTNTADVTERHGVVTVTNRRMKKDAIDRADNALRKKRSRVSRQCHSDVTEKSQHYISEVIVHSSETLSQKERERESEIVAEIPSVPNSLTEAAVPILGVNSDITLMLWLKSWTEDWILRVLSDVAVKGISGMRAKSWCEAVLRDWKRNGGPDAERTDKRGNAKHGKKNAKPSGKFAGRD